MSEQKTSDRTFSNCHQLVTWEKCRWCKWHTHVPKEPNRSDKLQMVKKKLLLATVKMLRSIFSVSPLPIWFSVVVLLLLLLFWFVRLFVVHWPVVVAFVYFCSICSVSIYASRKKMFVALFECKQHTLTQCSIIIYSNTSTSLLTCIQFICYRLIDLWLGFFISQSV